MAMRVAAAQVHCMLFALAATAAAISSPHTFTLYSGRISSEETWHDVLLKPFSKNYTDSYLVAVAYQQAYQEHLEGALRLEYEINAAYNFGEQNHWELNVAPITLRWQRFPWNEARPTDRGARCCVFTIALPAGVSWG